MLNSIGLENTKGTYYAYTFANGIEEPLLKGKRTISADRTEYAVDVEHGFNIGQNAFSAYLDGVLCPNIVESSNTGKFIVPQLEGPQGTNPYDTRLTYFIERPEKTELKSCERELLTAANRNTDYINAYDTTISLIPGVVSVYVNGVRLDKDSYNVIDPNTIIINDGIVGSQNNYNPNNKDTWKQYIIYDKTKQYTIDCDRSDEILIEVRQDYSLKSQTIPARFAGQRAFYMDDDGLPKSLILSQDIIKIYIDGILYDGEYIINRDNGSIVLLDTELEFIINTDPIARYFDLHPDEHERYIYEHKTAYVPNPKTTQITFEWR